MKTLWWKDANTAINNAKCIGLTTDIPCMFAAHAAVCGANDFKKLTSNL